MVQQGVNPLHHTLDVAFVACPSYAYPFGLVFELRRHVQGDHENRNLGRLSSDFPCGVQAVHYGHLEIEYDYVGRGLLGSFYGFLAVGCLTANLPRVLLFQKSSQASAHELAIVYDQDSDGRGFWPCVPNSHTSTYELKPDMSIRCIA